MQKTHSTNTVLMISPDTFQFNAQTASTNGFQQISTENNDAYKIALQEFQQMVAVLRSHDVRVITLSSREDLITPDAVFPNNWFSVHQAEKGDITLVLYPMLAESRRLERQVDALMFALKNQDIEINNIVDFTHYEQQNKALEGTGSLVLDRVNRVAFASLSPRTDATILTQFVEKMQYTPIVFHSYDKQHKPIYHTNVVLSVGSSFAVISADNITDHVERMNVIDALHKLGKEIIQITPEQMEGMAANILEVKSIGGDSKIIMSETAFNAFGLSQRNQLSKYGELVAVSIPTIEKLGGGSARCMLAEIFH